MTLAGGHAGGSLNSPALVVVDVVVFKNILIDVSAVCMLYHGLIEGSAEKNCCTDIMSQFSGVSYDEHFSMSECSGTGVVKARILSDWE